MPRLKDSTIPVDYASHYANGLFHDAYLPASVALLAKALVAAGISSTLVSPH